MTQLDINLFELPTGAILRDAGMKKAIDNANALRKDWSESAYLIALRYCRQHEFFMTEDIREYAKDKLPDPPSARAWGGIITTLARASYIGREGYRPVKNAKAHCTPATVWKSYLYLG